MNLNNPLYSPWNIESTAKIILSRLPDSAVFVIKPSKMFMNTFSIYKNFLCFDEEGIPEFTKDFGAVSHLHSLYKAAMLKMLEIELSETIKNGTHGDPGFLATSYQADNSGQATKLTDRDIPEHPVLSSVIPTKLIGFSKGCVVLNQLIHELDHCKDDETLKIFLSSISEIYWLDGGHVGGQGAYITEDDKLKNLKKLGCRIIIHVTPYQINDPMRKWIGEEEEKFVTKLKELNANVIEYRHFTDDIGMIQNHFKVLTLF